MNRITHLPWPDTLKVRDGETGAPGEVIDICDGWRVRVQWMLNRRITRVPVERLRPEPTTDKTNKKGSPS